MWLCVVACCRPAVQSSGESYGGLTEDSLGEAYNSSKDGTLVMREVMNAHTHTPEKIPRLYFAITLGSFCFSITTLSSPSCKLLTVLLFFQLSGRGEEERRSQREQRVRESQQPRQPPRPGAAEQLSLGHAHHSPAGAERHGGGQAHTQSWIPAANKTKTQGLNTW